MKLQYLGHTETKLWFEQMELYSTYTMQYGHNPRLVATIFVKCLSQLQICYLELIFHIWSIWCATSFASLSAISLPSNPVCPSIFISLMSTDKLANGKARKVNITITYIVLTLSNLALMTVTAHHLVETFCIFRKLGEYGKITAKRMLASLVAM